MLINALASLSQMGQPLLLVLGGIVMNFQSIKNMYFSPTGGTKKVTTLLSQCFSLPMDEIDFSSPSFLNQAPDKLSFSPETLCIIGVPSFGGRVPAIALQNLSTLKGEQAPVILVVSYGNRDFEDTLLELRNQLTAQGFHCIAGISAVTQHSIMNQYGNGRPDSSDEQMLQAFMEQLKSSLASISTPKELPFVDVPGNFPYRQYGVIPMYPQTSLACNGCGLCSKQCPVQAIPKESPNKTDTSRCISCMRCISICPNHARACDPLMLTAVSEKLKPVCSTRKENQFFFSSI